MLHDDCDADAADINPEGVDADFPADEATLGGRIVMARTARGVSAEAVANELKVDAGTLKTWESDRAEPDADMLPALADTLRVSAAWLSGTVGGDSDDTEDGIAGEAAELATKLDQLTTLHETTSALLADVRADVDRLQSDIDEASAQS